MLNDLYFFEVKDTLEDRRNSILGKEDKKEEEDLNLSVKLFPFQIQSYESESKIKYLDFVSFYSFNRFSKKLHLDRI